MSPTLDQMREGVRMCSSRAFTEASGGITIETAREIADTGVESTGIQHVLVGGRFVRRDGLNDQNERPGIPILRDPS